MSMAGTNTAVVGRRTSHEGERERPTRVKMQWSLFFLSLILAMAHADMLKLNGSATQSSDWDDTTNTADKATDGDKTICSHTKRGDDKPWWRIDLGDFYTIDYINVTQRDWNEDGMLQGVVIHIGNTTENNGNNNPTCATITCIKPRGTKKMKCGTTMTGRYVSFHHTRFVVLCEVEVYGKKADSPLILVSKSKTWEGALDYCRENYHDLASIPDDDDMQVWAVQAAKEANTSLVWLGLRYTCVLDFWFWVSDQCFSFNNWAPGNGSNIEECGTSGAMEKEGGHRWVSKNEAEKFHFICEK